jgi:bacterial/archaeal transporter family-2 protein
MAGYLNVVVGLAVGALVVIQGAMNTRVMTALGSAMSATLVNFIIGAVTLFGVMVVTGHIATVQNLSQAPRWSLLAGVAGAMLVMGTAFLIPRVGTAQVVALLVCGQALTSLVFDHFGLLGVPVMEISLSRLAGCGLLVLGAVLIGR